MEKIGQDSLSTNIKYQNLSKNLKELTESIDGKERIIKKLQVINIVNKQEDLEDSKLKVNKLKVKNESLRSKLDDAKNNFKEMENLISMLNNNRASMEIQLKNYKAENERLNKQFDEYSSLRKELRNIKEKNMEILSKTIDNAYKGK